MREVGGELLTRFGGHAQACGFSLDSDENVKLFAEVIRNHAAESLKEQELKPILKIETQIDLKDLTMDFLETLNQFEPFGEANPKPLFMTANLTVVDSSMVGASQNHVRALLQDDFGKRQKVIGFYKTELKDVFTPGSKVDIVYDISKSEWNGRTEIQCKLIDARTSLS